MVEGRCMLQTLQHCPPEEGGALCKSSQTQDKSSVQDVSLTAASPAQCSVSQRGGSPGTPQPPAGSSAGCTSAAAAKTPSDTVTGDARARHPRSGDGKTCRGAAPICTARKGTGSTSGNLPPWGTWGWEGRCIRSPAGLVGHPTARPQCPGKQAEDRQRESSPSPSARLRAPCAARRAQPQTHLEQVEIHLLGVRVLLLVHRHEEVFHVHHHAQQPVDLLLRDVLQVGHMVRCDREKAAVRTGGSATPPPRGEPGHPTGRYPVCGCSSGRARSGWSPAAAGPCGGRWEGWGSSSRCTCRRRWPGTRDRRGHHAMALRQGCRLLWSNSSPHQQSPLHPSHPLQHPALLSTHPA